MSASEPLTRTQPALGLVRRLCEALRAAEIDYCHWKSNAALDRSAKGENDLDLLVRRSDAQRFGEILHRLQFKLARAPVTERIPGILDYYGYDAEADRFVHVHAHYQLVVGHDRTKNLHLPIEAAFLRSSSPAGLFRVPEPEFEFVVFVIRMTLKHLSWEAALGGEAELPAGARAELDYLEERIEARRVDEVLAESLPFVDADVFHACAKLLRPGPSFWSRARAARRLRAQLGAHARRSRLHEIALGAGRRVARGLRRRMPRGLPRKRLNDGGALIAIVGGDGAGKSTAVEALHAWLAKDFDVDRVHLGKPPWSRTTVLVRGLLKPASVVGSLLPARRGGGDDGPSSSLLARYRAALWLVCTARDRYLAYARARRFATNGGLMICDRYPLPQIKRMDWPLIAAGAGTSASRGVRFLAGLEERFHASIPSPDILAVLRVDPEIAVARKTDETPESVRPRSREVWECDWRQTKARVIDASQTREQVLAELKSYIWSEL